MSPSLDKQLCEKYPNIFKNRYKDPTNSPICFGIQCGDGWYSIIDATCEALTYSYSTSAEICEEDGKRLGIEPNSFNNKYYIDVESPQVIADQVKEKFGGLRFYYHLEHTDLIKELLDSKKNPDLGTVVTRYENYFDGVIHMAEVLASRTCEDTGREGEMHVTNGGKNGWYKTLNVEYAKANEFYISRNYVPVSSLKEQDEQT
jgi:hypothetical protein